MRRIGNVTVIELAAEYDALDQAKFQAARESLLAAVRTVEPPLIVLDLHQTAYFGSAFLSLLSRALQEASQREGRLVICNVQPFCQEVLRIAHMDDLLAIHAGIAEAVAALEGGDAA